VARVTNLQDRACRESLRESLAASLEKEGESNAEAGRAADETVSADPFAWGARPFVVSTRSGADYGSFVQPKGPRRAILEPCPFRPSPV
jgi:hypothetical protein